MRDSDIFNKIFILSDIFCLLPKQLPQVNYKGNSIIPILKNRLSENQRNIN